jgi:hypothetical protein
LYLRSKNAWIWQPITLTANRKPGKPLSIAADSNGLLLARTKATCLCREAGF